MKFVFSAVLSLCAGLAAPDGAQQIDVTYLQQAVPAPPVLSNLDPIPDDLGIAGARRGLADNATTGRFAGQDWTLEVVSVPPGEDFAGAARAALERTPFIVLDAPAQAAMAAADLPEAASAVLFNATATDSALRDGACRANMLHTIPSRAMLADALMQFLLTRRWEDVVLIEGTMPEDTARAAAYARAARKFGMQIGARKTWAFDADMRRNASQEVPLFTQDLGDYDILLVADEANDFARYIAYNTWRPRPVAGSEGLVPVAWDRVVEQWGAAQLQSRFEEDAGRSMQDEDYGAWAALRALGEAVTRTGSDDPATLRAYMLGPDFALAGFKGRPMTFRTWNGQLRQPIPLVTRSAVVANAPMEGFLHQNTELDTLGIDAPETACTAFD